MGIVFLLLGTVFVSLGFDPIMETRAVVTINSLVEVYDERVFDEDVEITSSGHLIIHAGGTVKLGTGCYLNITGGKLTLRGSSSSSANMEPFWNYAEGIIADEDAEIIFQHAKLSGFKEALRCEGTGHSASTGSVRINDTNFIFNDVAVVMVGSSTGNQPYDFSLHHNDFIYNGNDIILSSGYDNVTIDHNRMFNSRDNSMEVIGCDDIVLSSNYISDCRNATLCGFIQGMEFFNNTVFDCGNGSQFGLFIDLKLHNNSYDTNLRGLVLDSFDTALVENNTMVNLGKNPGSTFHAEDGENLIVRNNIISGREDMVVIDETMASSSVISNLLTNLTARRYMDLDGDGFCDEDPILPGSAGMVARNCRTGVINLDGTISETYVNPAQAVKYGSGRRYEVLTQFDDFGPQMLGYKVVTHTESILVDRSVELNGDKDISFKLKTEPTTVALDIQSANDARIENVSLNSGINGVRIVDSGNVSLSHVILLNEYQQMEPRILMRNSNDVKIYDHSFWPELSPPLHIDRCGNISLDYSIVHSSLGKGITVERSDAVSFETSKFYGKRIPITFRDCRDTYLGDSWIHFNIKSDRGVVLDDCIGTEINDTIFTGTGIASPTDYIHLNMKNNTEGTWVHNSHFLESHMLNQDIEGIKIEGPSNNSMIEDCRFHYLESGLELFDDPLYPHHAEGFTVKECEFEGDALGLSVSLIGNLTVQGCQFKDCDDSLGIFMGDLNVMENEFRNFDMGVVQMGGNSIFTDNRMVNGSSGYSSVSFLEMASVITHNNTLMELERGYQFQSCDFELNSDHVNSSVLAMKCRDTDGSLVNNSVLDSAVPILIESTVVGDRVSVELRNCTGDYENSNVSLPHCYANWTWPLTVEVVDEVDDPIPADLGIWSSQGEEVFSGSVPGYYHNQSVLGYSHSVFGGNLTMNDYMIRAQEGGNEKESYVNMTSPQHLTFRFNHVPTVDPGAPSVLTFEEDTTLEENVSGWFLDRDQLDISLVSSSDNISASLEGTLLSLIPAGNWSGVEALTVSAEDTLGEIVSHTVDVNVTEVNDAPVQIEPIPELVTEEDRSAWIELGGYFTDVDDEDLEWGNNSVSNCTLEWNASNLTLTPVEDWYGVMIIPITISDGEREIEAELIFNVTPVNDPPVWKGEDPLRVDADVGVEAELEISRWIEDVDTPLDLISVMTDSGNVTYSEGSLTVLYPEEAQSMNDTVEVTISDGEYSTSFRLIVNLTEAQTEWGIDDANVTVDPDTGDWSVEVEGNEDQDVWVVVEGPEGKESYRLEETSPGHYETKIPGSSFQPGGEYTYHFSDTEDGEDLTGGQFGGSVTQPETVGDDDTDEEDDDDDGETDYFWFVLIGLILIVAVIVIFVYVRSRTMGEEIIDFEE